MTKEKFHIQSIFYDTLTNGFRDDINSNPERLGFILGAIDSGFSVHKKYCLRAKYGSIEIYLRTKRDSNELTVAIFKKNELQTEMDYSSSGFMWDKIKIERGRLMIEMKDKPEYYEFICSTS